MFTKRNILALIVFIQCCTLLIVANLVNAQCQVDKAFSLSSDSAIYPLNCLVGPKYPEFKYQYTIETEGAGAYILSETQYNSFIAKERSNPKYTPLDSECVDSFYASNRYLYIKGNVDSKKNSNYGNVRLLVKRTEYFTGIGNITVQMTITPQDTTIRSDAPANLVSFVVVGVATLVGLFL